jgi:hypothetical protein
MIVRVRVGGSEHADFPQRGKSAPIQPSLFSPSERNHARSGFIGDSSPPTLTLIKEFRMLPIYSLIDPVSKKIIIYWMSG